jgi:CheY-like chemotaxis protein
LRFSCAASINKNGYEATTEIRALETSSRTPIIAVTAGILAGEKINVLNQEWMIYG